MPIKSPVHIALALLTIAGFLVSLPVKAETAAPPHFFTTIQDLPLMPGIVEIPEQTLSYDKPEGRIIEAVAEIQDLSGSEVFSYYASVLPHFGWRQTDQNNFVRGQEQLHLVIEDYEAQSFLHITITPH